MNNYDGTLIIVSHDRDFLQGLTDKVYEFRNQNIKEYIGDIDAFLAEQDLLSFKQLESSQKDQKNVKQDKTQDRLTYDQQKKDQKKIKELQNRVSKLEKEIDLLESSKRSIDADLANPDKFKELSQKEGFFEDYEKNNQKIDQLIKDWEYTVDKLNKLKE